MTEPVIDAHYHIWRVKEVPWLSGPPVPRIFGDYEPLRHDYPVDELLREITPHSVTKSVYVQINVAPGREVAEVESVQSVAAAHGYPHGIVGYADLSSPHVGSV